MTAFVERAAAKINLTLEVLGRRADGYHELVSLVAFAPDVHDVVTLEPGPDLAVEVTGRIGAQITGENLVSRAADLAREVWAEPQLGRFIVDKNIPVAAGVGGGSADAAAALRAIARANPDPGAEPGADADAALVFGALAPRIGADVAVCLGGGGSEAALMSGIGERVVRPDDIRPGDGPLLAGLGLHIVLVNPGVQVATGAVFQALAAPACENVSTAPVLPRFRHVADLLDYMQAARNDLERPARGIAPVIDDVLAALRAQPDCLIARMSGSGATCFGLFQTAAQAERAAKAITKPQPAWWAASSRLS